MTTTPADDMRGAIALVQALIQADPHNLTEWGDTSAAVIEATWPAEDLLTSTTAALYAVTLLALSLADELTDAGLKSEPDQVAATLARVAARLDETE